MDAKTLATVMGNAIPLSRYEELVSAYNEAAIRAQCVTVPRAAMFAAQLGHESVGLKYMEEIADGSAYEGRADLGNNQSGDGKAFKGRGPIQLTGRGNYDRFGKWCFEQGLTPRADFFTADASWPRYPDPRKVAEPKWGFLAAAYYWTVARPQLNSLADARDLVGATKAINGGLNGLQDRDDRYRRALVMGEALLPEHFERTPTVEKRLDYLRDQIRQDTFYNCGPASAQTIIGAHSGKYVPESELGKQMGTHTGGTDHIGLIQTVLNRHLPNARYAVVQMPNDPASPAQREDLWEDVRDSVDAGYGVVANIVAPPNNYPRGVNGSVSPQYGGGTVYHYFAIMGYSDKGGARAFWVADSGFAPYGYWCSLEQMSTLIPPKGYAYATADPVNTEEAMPDNQLNRIESKLDELLGQHGRDAKTGKYSGWPQGGGRSLYDTVSAVAAKLGVPRTSDTKP
jgi:predicted chitinase